MEKEGLRLKLRRAAAPGQVQPPVPAAPAASPPEPAPPAAQAAPVPEPTPEVEDGLIEFRSPIVGTFYRSPRPESPPFVNEGDRVEPGQVLCIVEAMKVMNEIEAEEAGQIVQVLPTNAQPVEFDEVLFRIRPLA
jgi:acetyl-CoA carboxylase biotin carboxyl carrier protein